MRVPIRNTCDLCLAAMALVLGFVLDVSLVSVFKANLQRALAVPRYRAVYLRSGRRNRVRY
jgi:hypothetical protein